MESQIKCKQSDTGLLSPNSGMEKEMSFVLELYRQYYGVWQ